VTVGEALTICVCTYNSAKTLTRCLARIRSIAPESRLLVVDHCSQDETIEIAARFDSEVFREAKGLGYARQLCFDNTTTEYIAFVDSDVEIMRPDFFDIATRILQNIEYGAVVGMAVGHRFQYGLPASLLVLRKRDFMGKIIPDYIDARETFFIQKHLDRKRSGTYYVLDSMVHRSQFRKFKPEWEGANTRLLPNSKPRELLSALKVIMLLSLNSRNVKNIVYAPIFYVKFLRGFASPAPWLRMKRQVSVET